MLGLVYLLGPDELGYLFLAAVVVALGVLWYEQRLAIHDRFETAFFTLNGVIALVLGVTGIADILLGG